MIKCLSLLIIAFSTVLPAQTADDALAKLRSDPSFLTPEARVTLKARSQGGKSRYTPWATDYGSYNRVDTASRQYLCALQSTARIPQRVRLQCFVLLRSLDTGKLTVTLAQDLKVDLPVNGIKTAQAQSYILQTDDNYAALGVRERAGDKYLGWTWRAIGGNNQIVGISSSSPGYDHYATEQPVQPFMELKP